MLILDKRYVGVLLILITIVVAVLVVMLNERLDDEKTEVISKKDRAAYAIPLTKEQTKTYQHKQYVSRVFHSTTDIRNEQHIQASEVEYETGTADEIVDRYIVNVWLEEKQVVESVALEDYVLAVTMNEIPWSFHDEAVKAQMIASRSYIMYRIQEGQQANRPYDVTDSTKHQVYRQVQDELLTEEQQKTTARFRALLNETSSQVITYEGNIIDALYFSTSNGKTESAANYFGSDIPYLQGVSSEWDKAMSPSYSKQVTYSFEEYFTKLNQAGLKIEKGKNPTITILHHTPSKRIEEVEVNGVILSGRMFREIMELASSDITWSIDTHTSTITFTTTGYGHGVGMSQWGAEGMAREGYSSDDILQHYYTNIEVTSL